MLIGRFYNEAGEPTEALLRVQASLAEGKKLQAQSEAERIRFPSCNSEWTAASGGRFWCSTKRYVVLSQCCIVLLMCNTAFLTLVGERSAHKETQG